MVSIAGYQATPIPFSKDNHNRNNARKNIFNLALMHRQNSTSSIDTQSSRGDSRPGSGSNSPVPPSPHGERVRTPPFACPWTPVSAKIESLRWLISRFSGQPQKEMDENGNSTLSVHALKTYAKVLGDTWLKDEHDSFLAFSGLLQVLELTLDASRCEYGHFAAFVDALDAASIKFLSKALYYLIDSDNVFNTDYVDSLLLHLSTYYVKTGRNHLAAFISSVPYFGGLYLRQHGKQFQELFAYIHTNRQKYYDASSKQMQVIMTPHYLCCMHFPPKKVIVSNAPPVKLKRRGLMAKTKFECQMTAGGLVSGIKPSLDKYDIWVSYLDTNVLDLDKLPQYIVPRIIKESTRAPVEIRRSTSVIRFSSTSVDERKDEDEIREFLYEKAENDFLSLQKQLDRFAEQNFVVNPLIILKDDHKGFYNGISNGLLWPAFHNLPQYIVDEYLGEHGRERLAEDWERYIKVNYHFAIHAARSCRQQDFLWIHDYHLFLVGLILRSLDSSLDSGFFLHIPFGVTETFVRNFPDQGLSILRGLLGFTRVGFQTNKDVLNFVKLVKRYMPEACVQSADGQRENLTFTIHHDHHVTDVGAFPISVNTDNLLHAASSEETERKATAARERIMQGRQGKLFLSVERFDYTKGIVERMRAIDRYFEEFPERASLDVFYQVAASSRSDVSSYKSYQDQVVRMAEALNEKIFQRLHAMDEHPAGHYKPAIIIDQTNHPQDEVFGLYKAADVIVVTPLADGMNLVIKEAIICNPRAAFLLSTGAGSEKQLHDCGLSDCYLRLETPNDALNFASLLRRAVDVSDTKRSLEVDPHADRLFEFTKSRDIDAWVREFIDCNWTHQVVKPRTLANVGDLQKLMSDIKALRRQAVSRYLHCMHVGVSFTSSMRNALTSIDQAQCRFELSEQAKELQSDIEFVESFAECKPAQKIADIMRKNCIHGRELFDAEYSMVSAFISALGPVDLLIVRVEQLIVRETAFDFSTMQSLANGLLLARFMDRFCGKALLVSNESMDTLQSRLCTPCDNAVLLSLKDATATAGKRVVHLGYKLTLGHMCEELCNELQLLNECDKKVLILGNGTGDLSILEWARKRVGGPVHAIFSNVDERMRSMTDVNFVCLTCGNETFLAAMVDNILKTVTTLI